MSQMPDDGRFEYGKPDPVTGERWVYVSREMARAHPQGGLGPVLLGIVALMAGYSGLRFYEFAAEGAGLFAFANAVLAMLGALGLFLRSPWGLMLVIVMLGLTILPLIPKISALSFGGLLFLIALGAALAYLVMSEKANLIYRHRYRSFKKAPGE